jgi:hypothetical protein
MTLEWPGRCSECRQPIEDWGDAGLFNGRWIHKACWTRRFAASQGRGADPRALRSPIERSAQLEGPMLLFLLMFHFGLGGAVAGWVLLSNGHGSTLSSGLIFGVSLAVGLIGALGVALNIMGRRRIETIRQELEIQGGWKPGR